MACRQGAPQRIGGSISLCGKCQTPLECAAFRGIVLSAHSGAIPRGAGESERDMTSTRLSLTRVDGLSKEPGRCDRKGRAPRPGPRRDMSGGPSSEPGRTHGLERGRKGSGKWKGLNGGCGRRLATVTLSTDVVTSEAHRHIGRPGEVCRPAVSNRGAVDVGQVRGSDTRAISGVSRCWKREFPSQSRSRPEKSA